MAKELNTSILIHASPEKVWSVFSDFESYPQWNPFIRFLRGPVSVHKKITVGLQSSESSVMTIKPRVLVVHDQKELRWIGHLFFTGLFDGEHSFELRDNGNGTTTFIQRERFKGILVPLLKKMLDHTTLNGFNAMNQKLKERVENR